MTMLSNHQISVDLFDVDIKLAVTFTYKKALVDESSVRYSNDIVYCDIIGPTVQRHVDEGHKIEAIKQLRVEFPGLGLKDAKDIVEAVMKLNPLKEEGWKADINKDYMETYDGRPFVFPPDQYLKSDKYIDYIKEIRSLNNLPLKEAKDIAENIFARKGLR